MVSCFDIDAKQMVHSASDVQKVPSYGDNTAHKNLSNRDERFI